MKNITKTALAASLLIVGLGLAVNGYSQSFPTNGLAAYYPFNGNANDASGNGHNGINQGGVLVPDSFGYPNQAYRFDGTNGFIDVSQNRPITGVQTTFSICGWINPRYIPQLPHDETIGRGIYWHRADWKDIGVRINNSPWYSFTTTTLEFCTVPTFQSANHDDNLFASQLIPTNTWTAFVATYDGVTKRLYINGTLDVSVPYTFQPNWDTGFIGEGIGGNFAGQAETFDGIIDNIRIYNRALSASEVQQLYAYESQTHEDGAFQMVYGRFTWPAAKADAESRGGHLATFRNQAEWNAAQSMIIQFNSDVINDVWIGGYQPAGSPEPSGNWSWVTGEPWAFSFWWPGEPNQNQGINEDALMVGARGLGWVDVPSSSIISYVLEFEPRVDLIKAVKPSFSHLTLTTNYQMQISGDMSTWTNYGAAFTATNSSMVYPQYWDVDNWNSLFFRLQVSP